MYKETLFLFTACFINAAILHAYRYHASVSSSKP